MKCMVTRGGWFDKFQEVYKSGRKRYNLHFQRIISSSGIWRSWKKHTMLVKACFIYGFNNVARKRLHFLN